MKVDYTKIVEVRPDIKCFMMKAGFGNDTGMKCINHIQFSTSEFQKQIFLLKKWLKRQESPDDRLMFFECEDSNGVFSFDKYRRIFNSRLKPDENMELINEGDFIL